MPVGGQPHITPSMSAPWWIARSCSQCVLGMVLDAPRARSPAVFVPDRGTRTSGQIGIRRLPRRGLVQHPHPIPGILQGLSRPPSPPRDRRDHGPGLDSADTAVQPRPHPRVPRRCPALPPSPRRTVPRAANRRATWPKIEHGWLAYTAPELSSRSKGTAMSTFCFNAELLSDLRLRLPELPTAAPGPGPRRSDQRLPWAVRRVSMSVSASSAHG